MDKLLKYHDEILNLASRMKADGISYVIAFGKANNGETASHSITDGNMDTIASLLASSIWYTSNQASKNIEGSSYQEIRDIFIEVGVLPYLKDIEEEEASHETAKADLRIL